MIAQTTPKTRISITVDFPDRVHESAMTFYRRLTDEDAVEAFTELWRGIVDNDRLDKPSAK